jgi:hypothetical protein
MGTLTRLPQPSLSATLAAIAEEFRNECGWTLEETERRTVFLGEECFINHGTPEHKAEWDRHKARLLAETAHLVQTILTASPSAWTAASTILGIKLPLRPGDLDYDSPGVI